MREKRPALVITFDTTTAAMEAECCCLEQGLPGRLIPVPREITAGCGLAWKAPPQAQAQLTHALRAAGIPWANLQVISIL